MSTTADIKAIYEVAEALSDLRGLTTEQAVEVEALAEKLWVALGEVPTPDYHREKSLLEMSE